MTEANIQLPFTREEYQRRLAKTRAAMQDKESNY